MENLSKKLKLNLLLYLCISVIGAAFLLLAPNAAFSIPVFVIIQFVILYDIVPKKKPLLMFIPIFILSLNSFISANTIWRAPNFALVLFLYSFMCVWMIYGFSFKEKSTRIFTKMVENIIVEPFAVFHLPFKWTGEANKTNAKKIRRVLLGLAISIPCLIFLLFMLASADQIFQRGVSNFLNNFFYIINLRLLFRVIVGIIIGFYLFGLICSLYRTRANVNIESKSKRGDLIILNILLISILAIYTIFVAIQFRYLFAGAENLPYGLNFATYARRGFFELLALTGLNILLILLTVNLTKEQTGKWAKITKILLCYLCAVTVILLISSFYRMWLYNADYGLTRLRFLVFGFLIFEAIGLVVTFFYIIKPKFKIIPVYLTIGLAYYLLLNLVPMDSIIARDQIDRYFNHDGRGVPYTLTLSPDAMPQITRLFESENAETRQMAHTYLSNMQTRYHSLPQGWRQWNLAIERLLRIRG